MALRFHTVLFMQLLYLKSILSLFYSIVVVLIPERYRGQFGSWDS